MIEDDKLTWLDFSINKQKSNSVLSFKLIIDFQHLEKIRCLITSVIEVLNTFDTTFSNIFTTSAPSFKKHITKVFSHVSNLEKKYTSFFSRKR